MTILCKIKHKFVDVLLMSFTEVLKARLDNIWKSK